MRSLINPITPIQTEIIMYQATQRYIPGLTPRPQDTPSQPAQKPTPKEVPKELLNDYKNGSKNPISALTEYCAMRRLPISFREDALMTFSITHKFAMVCKVNGKEYPQGVGPTKKEAKTQAAKNAFNIILGLTDGNDMDDDENSVMFDALGRKFTMDEDKVVIDAKTALQHSQANAYGEKNAVVKLQEHCAQRRLPFKIIVSDESGPNGFDAYVIVDEQTVAEAFHKSKRDAKRLAAEEALDNLLSQEERMKMQSVPLTEEDKITMKCHKTLEKKLQEIPQMQHTKMSMAAFVVKKGDSEGEVVAIGTGNNVISSESLTSDGRCLVDSHAVTVARRSLLKYLFKEASSYFEGSKVISVFEQVDPSSNKLKLKDYVSIHLYISQPPCGDYAYCVEELPNQPLSPELQELVNQGAHLPAFNEDLPGWFCTKNEDNVVTAVEEDQDEEQTMDELQNGEDILVMSCSDKILLWNIVGLQGALLGLFCDPIYLTSIIIGKDYDHGHFTRAMCCRVYDILQESLPPGYRINHPVLSKPNYPFTVGGNNPTSLSMNWSLADEKVELVNGFSGRTDESSPHKAGPSKASRLCKAGFLHRFKELMKVSKQKLQVNLVHYCGAKESNVAYQTAKKAFKSHCLNIGVGAWVKKPREIEIFQS